MGLPVTGISHFNVFRVLKNKKNAPYSFQGAFKGHYKSSKLLNNSLSFSLIFSVI